MGIGNLIRVASTAPRQIPPVLLVECPLQLSSPLVSQHPLPGSQKLLPDLLADREEQLIRVVHPGTGQLVARVKGHVYHVEGILPFLGNVLSILAAHVGIQTAESA